MIVIRQCSEDSLAELAQLYTAVFSEPPYTERWSIEHATAYLARFMEMDPGGCLAATDGGVIVGAIFGYTYPWQSEPNYSIQELFVRAGRRGDGIGRQLIHHVVRQHGGNMGVALITDERTQAVSFYEGLGLRRHKTNRFYCGTITT